MAFDYYYAAGLASGIFSLLASIVYVVGTLRKDNSPNRLTWSIWMFGSLVILLSTSSMGHNDSFLKAGFDLAGYVLVFIVLPRHGEKFNKVDYLCMAFILFVGIVSVYIWVVSGPYDTMRFNLLVDFCGFIPTLVKAGYRPKSENVYAWIITGVGSCFSLIAAMGSTEYHIYSYYFAGVNGTMLLVLLIHRLVAIYKQRRQLILSAESLH